MFNGIYRRATSSLIIALFLIFALFAGAHGAPAQGTVFTYQGKLTDSGSAATGATVWQFKLFDAFVETGLRHSRGREGWLAGARSD